MSKFNQTLSIREQLTGRTDATVNHEGGIAFALDARSRLFTRVLASFCAEPKFYTPDGADELKALREDVRQVAERDPEFVLRLAAYARQEMHLRSTPTVLLAEAADLPSAKPFVRRWAPEIIRRADELTEVIGAWHTTHGDIGSRKRPGDAFTFPHALRKGIGDAFRRFDEYQLVKYDRSGAVTLRDALRISRPKPMGETQRALWKYLVSGEVDQALLPKLAAKAALLKRTELDEEAFALAAKAHVTWEVLTSKFGSSARVWNALELPFMAGIRNIANLMRSGADEALSKVIAMLRDPVHVRRSKQLPFRFLSAYRTLDPFGGDGCGWCGRAPLDERLANHPRRGEVLEALSLAMESSVANLPHLGGVTFTTADNSGSMEATLSERSTVSRKDVANLLAAIGTHVSDRAIASVFGESHALVPIVSSDSILTNMRRLATTDVGHSTNAWLAIRHLRETGTRVDRIILFSDMQCYSNHGWGDESLAEELRKYRSSVNPGVYLYSVDLAGYGTAQFPQDERRVALLAGWSEKLLAFIPLFEADGVQAVDRIAAWTPRGHHAPAEDAAV